MSSINLEKLARAAEQRGRPFRVLVVDDEERMREVFRDFCKITKAVEVEMASDGAEAIGKLRTGKFDLVTLDLIMPDMSGLEVLSEISSISVSIPVMIVTGNATEKLVNEAGIMGARRVLYKPIRLEHFIGEIADVLVGQLSP